jgi:hypothetical protein
LWFKMNGGDGVTQAIMSNTDLTTDAGFQILRNNANVIIIRAGDGDPVSGGADLSWTYTSTSTVVAADGWRGIIGSVNGTGTSGRFLLINSAGTVLEDNTFTVATGTTVNAQTLTYLGARADVAGSPDLFCNCDISSVIVENFPVTDNLIEQFKNHNPVRSSEEFTPILQSQMDMNVASYIFNDAAGTVPSANGDDARVIRNNVIGNFNTTPTFGALRRNASAASSGASPKFRTNILNGRSAIEFDGTDDLMTFLNLLFEEAGGKWTFFIVAENQDNANGSHWMRGENYIARTGASYIGGLTSSYDVLHPDNVGENIGLTTKNNTSDGPKVTAIRRDGTAFKMWNGNKVSTTSTITSQFSVVDMGLAHTAVGATWNFDGYLFIFKKYNGVMTDAQVEAEIDRLNSEYGL